MPIDPLLIKAYRAENKASGNEDEAALKAQSYGEFLNKNIHSLVKHRYFKKDWPEDIACKIDSTTAIDLAYFLLVQNDGSPTIHFGPMKGLITSAAQNGFDEHAARYQLTRNDFQRCSMMSLVEDWYRLRLAGALAGSYIETHKFALYNCLADTVTKPEPVVVDTHVAFFSLFLSVFKRSIESLDSTSSVTEIEL